jgi:transposase InsO family protein
MSRIVNPHTKKPYGVKAVCETLKIPRSTYYARKRRTLAGDAPPPARRGPKPALSDAQLLALIRADLDASPFTMEGYRKVWARLHFVKDVRVGRNRVLRLMRENNLLSPLRVPARPEKAHTGTIIPIAPNLLWGTDGTQVYTLEDGNVWIFGATDHYSTECVGWHVAKFGSHLAALEPIKQGLEARFGGVGEQAALGLSLRRDNGPQYIAEGFHRQVRHWGITVSPALPYEPETNGCIERFWRTLKEQCIYGRTFNTLAEVEAVVRRFIEDYNQHWRIERLGFKTPIEARQTHVNPAPQTTAA